MSKPINDPLEAAKVSNESSKKKGWGKKKKAAEEKAPEVQAEAPKPEPAPVAEAPKPKVTPAGISKFRIVKSCIFSRNGQVTKLAEGSVISSQHYGGMPGIEKMQANGVAMEKLED